MLADLKTLGSRLGVSDRVHWLGNVSDLRSLLQTSDIFALASVGEAFGLALAEAMACGVPVVGSRNGFLVDVVENERTGLLSTPLDDKAFAEEIERLVRDAARRTEMGRLAVDRARRDFTIDLAVEKTTDIYESPWKEVSPPRTSREPLRRE